MRGENPRGQLGLLTGGGSPPHAWGKSAPLFNILKPARFTPTCVGKIGLSARCVAMTSVHPHMRGENPPNTKLIKHSFGSPPHAWGKFAILRWRRNLLRFTPTCVGKIKIPISCNRMAAVHPHMRGENKRLRMQKERHHGSPPHAWGKSWQHGQTHINRRFTPTCVGKISM